MREYQADIAVVGGGTAGLAAAVFAAQQGLSVIVMEKTGTSGGCANMAAGVLAYESRLQREMQETVTVSQAFREHMEYTHYAVDAKLTKKFFEMSGGIIDWLESIGVEFTGVYRYFPNGQRTWHIVKAPNSQKPTDRSGLIMMNAIAAEADRLGVRLLFNTPAAEIIMEDGFAAGVKGRDQSGQEVVIRSDAVIVATNGFTGSSEMGPEVYGRRWIKDEALAGHDIPGLTGDGLKMLWSVGAAREDMGLAYESAVPGITDKHLTIDSVMHQADLLVDLNGKRVMNEEYCADPTSLSHQLWRLKGRRAFTIITDEILEYYRAKGLPFRNPIHTVSNLSGWEADLNAYQEEQAVFDDPDEEMAAFFDEISLTPGGFWVCGSLEEISQKTGIDYANLCQTIREYNACANGYDTLFEKSPRYMKKIEGSRYYVAMHQVSGLESRGGIKTDEFMRCLDSRGNFINGLYCIGSMANNIMGDCASLYRLFGASIGFAFCSAKIAVEDISRFLEEAFVPE